MERGTRDGNDVVGTNGSQWKWWAVASVSQFSLGALIWRRGFKGSSSLLPVKAFFVGSLFPASLLTASIAALRASGIKEVEELVEVGANLRKSLGVRPTSGKD